jgi:hypothetical protein
MDEDEDDKQQNRIAAQEVVTVLRGVLERFIAELMGLGRWMLATLVVINGAGAVAVLSAPLDRWARAVAGAFFVAGILAALGAGFTAVFVFKRLSRPLGQFLGYALTVVHDGERAETLENEIIADLDKAATSSIGTAIAALSVVTFVGGCAVIALGLK